MTDTPLEVKLISQQQAVPEEPMVVATLKWACSEGSSYYAQCMDDMPETILNDERELMTVAQHKRIVAMLSAAPTPPAQQPVQLRFPTMLRKMWSGGEVQAWLDEQGPLYTAPPAQQSKWVKASERLPEVADGDEQELIVCVRRARNGESYVFSARYLNQYPLYSEDDPDADEDGRLESTGWYDVKEHYEYEGWYSPLIDAGSGDEVTHWMPLPAAPGDTAAPEQASCAECGKKASDGWALYCVKCAEQIAPPAPEQAEQPASYVDDLIERLEDAQQEINLAANITMSQALCDAAALLDEVEVALMQYTTPPAAEQAEQQCQQCAGTGYDCPDCIHAAEQDAVKVPRELLCRITRNGGVDTLLAIDELRALLGGGA